VTSRSFARVIQTLNPELRHPVCIFYLILRGLDTVEDDMTLPLARKTEVLSNFSKLIHKKGWKFDENGPNEKDRVLLVRFDTVIDEFLKLDEK
jgi:farnesyl-diphosphate farnesyltransferase